MSRAWFIVVALWLSLSMTVRIAGAATIFEFGPASAPSLQIDPWARAAGMGGACSAVFWGPTDGWANPALLGDTHGVGYAHGSGNFDPVDLTADRIVAGGAGIGFATSGRPVKGFGGSTERLDDIDFGDGPFSLHEHVRAWGAGVSLRGLATKWAERRDRQAPGFLRRTDVELGVAERAWDDELLGLSLYSPDPGVTARGPVASGVTHDWGALVSSGLSIATTGDTLALDGAMAFTQHNFGPETIEDLFRFPAVRQNRVGLAARIGWHHAAPWWPAELGSSEPLVSLGLAWDPSHQWNVVGGPPQRVDDWGAELGLGGVLFARAGASTSGGESSSAWGIGASLPLGHFGRVRYDHASTARRALGDRVTRDTFGAWIDPLELRRHRTGG